MSSKKPQKKKGAQQPLEASNPDDQEDQNTQKEQEVKKTTFEVKEPETPVKKKCMTVDMSLYNSENPTNELTYKTDPTVIPVKRPNDQQFFRIHDTIMFKFNSIKLKDANLYYLVRPDLLEVCERWAKVIHYYLGITDTGDLFLYPLTPSTDEKEESQSSWATASLRVIEAARKGWVQTKRKTGTNGYHIKAPLDPTAIGEPEWPEDLDPQKIVDLAFGDHQLTDIEDDVIRELRGLKKKKR